MYHLFGGLLCLVYITHCTSLVSVYFFWKTILDVGYMIMSVFHIYNKATRDLDEMRNGLPLGEL